MYGVDIYITYLTVYYGEKLPPYYIGSTYLENVTEKNYHGSVASKKYGKTWKEELTDNPHLFETIIISKHGIRSAAFEKELELHKSHDVVKNPLFINQAFAKKNGCYGADTGGELNGFWNKTHTKKTRLKFSGELNGGFKGWYHTPFGRLASTTEILNLTDLISESAIHKWCKKNPDKVITPVAVGKSKYLTKADIGKTFRQIGFWFEEATSPNAYQLAKDQGLY